MSLEVECLIPVVNLSSLEPEQLLELFDFIHEHEVTIEENNPVIYLAVSENKDEDTSLDTALLVQGIPRGANFIIHFDMSEEEVEEILDELLSDDE